MKFVAAAAFVLAALSQGAAAQTAFAPVAVVNDNIVTYYDVEQRARLLQLNGATPGPALNSAALEQLIDDRLRAQAGARYDITASEEEMVEARAEFAGRLRMDGPQLNARLKSLGVSDSALTDFLTSQVVWRDLINARFSSRATPTEVELDQEIALAASGEAVSYHLLEIAVAAGPGQEAQAEATIQRVLAELRNGGDFAALARRYSQTPSAPNGGDVGWVPETALPPALADLIGNTPVGGFTAPFQVPGGVSIYLVAERQEEVQASPTDVTVTLKRVIVPSDGAGDAAAMARAREIADATRGCASVAGRSDGVLVEDIVATPLSTLPGQVQDAVRLMEVGQSSRPVRAEGSVDVFVVCDKAGGLNADQRAQLREQIRTRRLNRLADGYLQELRREAVIERR